MKYDRWTVPALAFMGVMCSIFSNFAGAQSNEAGPIHINDQQVNHEAQGPGPEELRIAGLAVYSRGHLVQARLLMDRAMVLAEHSGNTYLLALIHDGLGCIYQEELEFIKAEREFKEAIDLLRKQPGHEQALATALANLSTTLSGERRYRESSIYLSEASKLIKDHAINDPRLRLHILNVSAGIYFRQGRLKKAEAMFLRSLALNPESDTEMCLLAASVMNNLGTLYAVAGNSTKAVVSYTRALRITEERLGSSHPNLTTILENLGFAYIRMGRPDEAQPHFLRSLTILEDNRLTVSAMGLYTLNGLGRTYMQTNQFERAEAVLARAVKTGRTIHAETPEMAQALELYETVLRALSKQSEAENLHAEAARIRAELLLTIRATP